jgi:hypothetical protein
MSHKSNVEEDITTLSTMREAIVTVHPGCFCYLVDFGPNNRPKIHQVGKDKRCTCGLGANCPAVGAVANYLKAGGERAPDPPAGFYSVVPRSCPICGAATYYVPDLNSKRRGAGFACVKGSKAHYWEAHVRALRTHLAENPWIFPPVLAPDGEVLYPGLKRDDLITESQPWPDGYNPNQ